MTKVYRKSGRRSFTLDVSVNGKRRRVGLGRVKSAVAKQVVHHVDELLAMRGSTVPVPPATAAWLEEIDDGIHKALVKAGVTSNRAEQGKATLTVSRMFELYLQRRTDLAGRSRENIQQARNAACKFFGTSRDAGSISPAEAQDFRRAMVAKHATATVATHIKKTKQVFKDAVDRRLIASNPLSAVKAGSQKNRDRLKYIDRETIQRVIDEAPDAEWRLLIKLARYGGLRMPSEVASLTWDSILWDKSRIIINSQKQKGTDKAVRIIPLFPELQPELQQLFDRAEPGEKQVLPFVRNFKNLRTRFMGMIERAGCEPWPRLWHNLRASRQTELAATLPIHVVCAWIGNSEQVATDHYLQVTDADFDRFKTGDARGDRLSDSSVSNRTTHTTHGGETHGKHDKQR